MADVRPGSWVGDTVEEFKKLPTWGKILAGGVLVAVAGLGYMRFRAGQNAGPGASTGGAVGSAGSLLPATNDPSTVIGTAGNPVIGAPGPQGPPGAPGPTGPTGIFTTGPLPPGVPIPTPPHPIPTPPPPPVPKPPPPRQPPPPPKLQTYTVVHGDNLSEIAAKLGIRGGWQAIYNQNRSVIGSNPNLIYAGQVYNISGLR